MEKLEAEKLSSELQSTRMLNEILKGRMNDVQMQLELANKKMIVSLNL